MATSTPNRTPSTPPPAAPRARTRKPSAKVLETQQALRTHTTAAQPRQARTRTTASQSYAEEAPSAQQHADDELPPFPTQRESISPERGGGSARLDEVIQLITSLKETIAQQSNIMASQTNTIASQTSAIESIRADFMALRAEQQNLRDQNAELQETVQQLRALLDTPSFEPQSTPTWAAVAASGRLAGPGTTLNRETNSGTTRKEDSRQMVIDVSRVRGDHTWAD